MVRRSCFDSTGIGTQKAEEAAQAFGQYKVEEIFFTRAMKEELAIPVRTAFEDRSLRVPDDERLIGDLRMIKKKIVGDHIRFVAEDEEGNTINVTEGKFSTTSIISF